jgi:hypothetical protein
MNDAAEFNQHGLGLEEKPLPRVSMRGDAARRAVRDGDVKTLKWLIDEAGLFEKAPALRKACISGAWGSGDKTLPSPSYSTTDSILLHELLLGATTRGHVKLLQLLLDRFPAKSLHILEWELIINAIAQASVEMLSPYMTVDPELVKMQDSRYGNCFSALFSLSDDPEQHLPVARYLLEHGADPNMISGPPPKSVLQLALEYSTSDVVDVLKQYGAKIETVQQED